MKNCKKKQEGFTLIELLIVITIIAILAVVVFVALNPSLRFKDSRDTVRVQDVINILNAIRLDQIDNGGSYHTNIDSLATGTVYMITNGNITSGCNDHNAYCDTNIAQDNNCVNLNFLETEYYMGKIPISPSSSITHSWSNSATGYTLEIDGGGIATIRACESENSDEISATR